MYCGTCIHDNTLAAALIRKGHEVALIPTYTPMRTEERLKLLNPPLAGAHLQHLGHEAIQVGAIQPVQSARQAGQSLP